jgi:hypothetical protein
LLTMLHIFPLLLLQAAAVVWASPAGFNAANNVCPYLQGMLVYIQVSRSRCVM